VGAENPVTSCDVHVFVYEAAEPVPSQWPDRRAGVWGSVACGRVLTQRSVRTVSVVVRQVLVQHCCEVSWPGDQEVVEAFAAQGADEAFRDRVRSRCPNWGADDANVDAGEHGVERGSELAVPVAKQEPKLG
jgi:hypothetical protein